jgi:3-ketosteroid 9alpha-monooxygenase subunit A
MALKTDGPFKIGRKWYSQFYSDPDVAKQIQAEVNGCHYIPGVDKPADHNHAIDDGLPI